MTMVMTTGAVMPSSTRRHDATVPVTLFGSWRNARSWRVRLWLLRAGVDHDYVDVIDHDDIPGSRLRRLPAIRTDGEWLVSPSSEILRDALERHGFRSAPRMRDSPSHSRVRQTVGPPARRAATRGSPAQRVRSSSSASQQLIGSPRC